MKPFICLSEAVQWIVLHGCDVRCSVLVGQRRLGRYEIFYNGDKLLMEARSQQPKGNCRHERLNEDGICRRCGADCRGVY